MAEPKAPVSEDDIADVSLVDPTPETPQEDAPSETADKPNEGADTQDKPKEDEAKPDANDSEAKDPPADQPQEDQPTDQNATKQDPTPDQQQDPRALAQRAYHERQRTRSQIADQLDQNFGPKTEEDLLEEGVAPEDVKYQALRSELAYKEQRAQIAQLNADMTHDSTLLLQELPVFNPNSPEYDEEFTKMVDAAYLQDAKLQTTVLENGSVMFTNAEKPLFDYYNNMARIYNRGASKGIKQRESEAMQMLSRTENPGGSSSTSGNSGNSLEELEERLKDVPLT